MNTTTDSIAAACAVHATVDTPLGPLLLARTERGLAGAWFAAQKHHPPRFVAPERRDDPLLRRAAELLGAWFERPHARFDLPLDLHGTPFQRAVWTALLAIPLGRTASYAAIAVQVGSATATRAVGAAIGRNPISLIVPCHRVVGSDGAMTGYAGGLDRKTALLRLERELALDRADLFAATKTHD